jgi:GT2 family glycosyltransferase
MVNFTMLAFNRPRLTRQALDSLRPVPKDLNITIYNNGLDEFHGMDGESEANTAYWVSVFCAGQPNAWTYCGYNEERGTGESRNHVIKSSEQAFGRGDYLYLSDNDVFFYPAIFEKLVPIYEYAWTLGFKVLAGYNHPFHIPIASYPVFGGGKQKISEIREVQAVALQSMLMKWEVWDKYGPFNETPPGRVCMGEDVDFCHKITADGGKLGVVHPPLLVNTGITNSFGERIPGWEMVQKECPRGILCE